jgi:hypothetical protein
MKKIWDETTDMGRLLVAAKANNPKIKRFADVAREIDVTEAVLTNWKRRGIPSAQIFELSELFSCNPKWLATGKGSMQDDDQNPYGMNWSKWTVDKAAHAKEIEEMPEEEFSTQKGVFKELVKSTKARRGQKNDDSPD